VAYWLRHSEWSVLVCDKHCTTNNYVYVWWLLVNHCSLLQNHSQLQQSKNIKINKNICVNTWQIIAVALLWTTVQHYVWWLWLRSSLVGWVGLFCRLVSWVGLGPLATGLGWVGSQKMDPSPCLCYSLLKADLHSLDFVVMRFLMKLFRTANKDIIDECRSFCNFPLPTEMPETKSNKFWNVTRACNKSMLRYFNLSDS